MTDKIREYWGNDIIVSFDPERCTHVGKCLRQLPLVFDKTRRPWVLPDAAEVDQVAATVLQCPTGALHFKRTDGGPEEPIPEDNTISIVANGPVNFRGDVEVMAADGSVFLRDTRVTLCRCGATKNRPFCDNSHCEAGFTDAGHLAGNFFQSKKPLETSKLKVTPLIDGPLLGEGNVEIRSADKQVTVAGSRCVLCRCGESKRKPFCDGTHAYTGFQTGIMADVGAARMSKSDYRPRFPLMILAIVGFLVALWAGLIRLGWNLPMLRPVSMDAHGPLMICGFLGLLIGLKRVAALFALHPAEKQPPFAGRYWAYAGPLLVGLGTLALIIGLPGWPGPLLITLGSLGVVVILFLILRHQFTLFTILLGFGALTWLIGNILWLSGWPIYDVVPWWIGFVILTIIGDRLKFSRILYFAWGSRTVFPAATGLLLSGLIVSSSIAFDLGVRMAYAGLIGLALWLLSNDIAWPTLRQRGLPRYLGMCLISSYLWLGVGGVLGVLFGDQRGGVYYDAILHAIFLGFLMAMFFGHAPIFFSVIVGQPFPFQTPFYMSLLLLHLSLLLRVGSDLANWLPGRQWGGLLNVVTILLFLAVIAFAIPRKKVEPRPVVAHELFQ